MDISSTASQLFGGGTASSVFYAGKTAAITQEQETARVTIDAQRQQINRIRGYKPKLTLSETQKLYDIRADIVKIEVKASKDTLRRDEIADHARLLNEADEIIGKPIVDIEVDEILAKAAGALEALLEPKLNKLDEKRVEKLERIKAGIEQVEGSNISTRRAQINNIAAQISQIMTPRAVSELSVSERRAYDDLANLINDHAGVKVQLTSKDALRVARLEESIFQLQANLAPDASSQPTSQAVARAYARLG